MDALPQLIWDIGTAYDFFISLNTLHHPTKFGLRGAWAAGVRSRLPNPEREFLQEVMVFVGWPLHWVYTLPPPKDARTALQVMADIAPVKRLPTVFMHPNMHGRDVLFNVAERGFWTPKDKESLQALWVDEYGNRQKPSRKKKKDELDVYLDWWTRVEAFGELILAALQSYYDVFFAEDELRIAPALQDALAQAQALAQKLPIPDLLEELSQGVQYADMPNVPELVLTPSFWGSPFLLYGEMSKDRLLAAFGARPSDASIVPGDFVPDALFQALKALADPTRLRILRYLMTEPLTPAELARRLRLRAPTVVHHLHALRLARLVQLTISHDGRRYQVRREAVQSVCGMLASFLEKNVEREQA